MELAARLVEEGPRVVQSLPIDTVKYRGLAAAVSTNYQGLRRAFVGAKSSLLAMKN
jgi:hypothetical protein